MFNPLNPFQPFTISTICFCSDADPDEVQNENSTLAMTKVLQKDFGTTFAEQQSVLGGLQGTLQNAVAKPQGYTPAMMAALRTGAVDTSNLEFNQAKAAAAGGAARYGGDVASGVTAQTVGGVAAAEAQTQSQLQNQITESSGQLQQQNYWKGISGLTNVGAAYNPTGVANAATSSANATTSAANAVQSEKEQSWQNTFGVIKGISGLAAGVATGGASLGLGALAGDKAAADKGLDDYAANSDMYSTPSSPTNPATGATGTGW